MNYRACTKCKEYITVHDDTYLSQQRQRIFEQTHLKHPIVTIDFDKTIEYKNVNIEIEKLIFE